MTRMRRTRAAGSRVVIGACLALLALPVAASAQTFTTFGVGTVSSPRGIAVDQEGNVYVADLDNSLIRKFDNTGGLLASFGDGAMGGVNLEQVIGVAVGNQKVNPDIFAATQGNQKVFRLDSGGNQITDYGVFNAPTSVEVDEANHVWVADAGDDIVAKFTLGGTLLNVYGKPGGGSGNGPGEFTDPLDVATAVTRAMERARAGEGPSGSAAGKSGRWSLSSFPAATSCGPPMRSACRISFATMLSIFLKPFQGFTPPAGSPTKAMPRSAPRGSRSPARRARSLTMSSPSSASRRRSECRPAAGASRPAPLRRRTVAFLHACA